MLFEYWSHAASFLPMRQFRYALPVMHAISAKGKHWYEVDEELKAAVLQTITAEGPKYARDFETPTLSTGVMWNWKPAKKALHELFMEGKLTVISREGFQRLYDLPQRFVPTYVDTSLPSYDEYLWFCIKGAIKAHGLCTIPEIRYQKLFSARELEQVINEKIEEKELVRVRVGGSKSIYLSQPTVLSGLPPRYSRQIHLLSPFDNAVIQRKRVKELFGFEYQTEIYYPAQKRVYGYFSMPILYGTEFIGRMDPKAHRDKHLLEIKNIVFEPSVKITDALVGKLKAKIKAFTIFNDCNNFLVKNSEPSFLHKVLNEP